MQLDAFRAKESHEEAHNRRMEESLRHRGKAEGSGVTRSGAAKQGDDEWFTPPGIVEPCRQAMGGIDLDPASNHVANRVVRAARFYTKEDDGLARPWRGRLLINPPYRTDLKARFIDKLAKEWKAGNVEAACLILSQELCGQWWRPMRGQWAAMALQQGSRERFYKYHPGDGVGGPGQGILVVYVGRDTPRFAEAFPEIEAESEAPGWMVVEPLRRKGAEQ